MKLVSGSISSYWYVLNYLEWLNLVNQEKKWASICGHIEYDQLGAKEDRTKISIDSEDHRKIKYEKKHMREEDVPQSK